MGYVWCEIRQQSSEEPCDETSFGKKATTVAEAKDKKAGWQDLTSVLKLKLAGDHRTTASFLTERTRVRGGDQTTKT